MTDKVHCHVISGVLSDAIAVRPVPDDWRRSCTRYLLDLAESADEIQIKRAPAVRALRWAHDAKEARQAIEAAAVSESAFLRSGGIRSLESFAPERARELATGWARSAVGTIHTDPQDIYNESFPVTEILSLADAPVRNRVLQEWLTSDSVAYLRLALSVLTDPTVPTTEILKMEVLRLREHQSSVVSGEARIAMAFRGHKATTEWLREHLGEPDVLFCVLSCWPTHGWPQGNPAIRPEMIREAIQHTESDDPVLKLQVARFDLITGGVKGRTFLWEPVLVQCLKPEGVKDAEALHYGSMAMSFLYEHAPCEDLPLARLVYRSNRDDWYRIPAAQMILRCTAEESSNNTATGPQASCPVRGDNLSLRSETEPERNCFESVLW